ncbi:peptide chain release factor N(5)-glutamine methyltransferase, partial [Candidatus Peregrinibacteria bacterium]|nr:peptide chain release factor N(5)-glutamine methyltransferase [Candidatus Peregrinibacteria bacterium]
EILLAYICGKHRTWILAHEEYVLTPGQERQWNTFRKRREHGEPIAYITGEKEFFGRSFHVDHSVLIPRPSTEGLVEMILDIFGNAGGQHSLPRSSTPRLRLEERGRVTRPYRSAVRIGRGERGYGIPLDTGIIGMYELWGSLGDIQTIVDIGTGSGCIAITLACELPEIHVIATDISTAALDIARMNAKRHNVADRIQFLHGDLLEPLCHPTCRPKPWRRLEHSRGAQNPFLVVSNPPYIPEGEKLPIDVTAYEPLTALYAGSDGLAVLRPLLTAARTHPACRGFIVECREDQENALGKT